MFDAAPIVERPMRGIDVELSTEPMGRGTAALTMRWGSACPSIETLRPVTKLCPPYDLGARVCRFTPRDDSATLAQFRSE